tara:strand:+ start:2846 stop:3040 length:195 start_codon:yes stop_codon:yes gene_type:complete
LYVADEVKLYVLSSLRLTAEVLFTFELTVTVSANEDCKMNLKNKKKIKMNLNGKSFKYLIIKAY